MGLYPKVETSHLTNYKRRVNSTNWFVDYFDGDDGHSGDRVEKPLGTLQEALDRCTAAAWDTIHITGHVITGEVTPFVMDKAHVRIIGDPYAVRKQSNNCAIIATGDTDCFTFEASDIGIYGLALYAGATAAGVGFAELAWSQRNLIERIAFMSGAYGVLSGAGIDSPGHHLSILDSYFNAVAGTINAILLRSNGSWPIIRGNFFDSPGLAQIYITGGMAAGQIEDNDHILSADTEGGAITMGPTPYRWLIKNNCANDNTVGAISANPFLEQGDDNIWVGNTKGGGDWAGIAPA